jgi:hypothetical protein
LKPEYDSYMGFLAPLQGLKCEDLHIRWASPIADILRPCRAYIVVVFIFDGLHPSLIYYALSGLFDLI